MKQTQKQLILKYLSEHPFMFPAKNLEKPYGDGFFGAELSRVCRRMRKDNILDSKRENGLEKFWLKSPPEKNETEIYDVRVPIYKEIKVEQPKQEMLI